MVLDLDWGDACRADSGTGLLERVNGFGWVSTWVWSEQRGDGGASV